MQVRALLFFGLALAAASVTAVSAVAAAPSAASSLAGAFGNTVISTYPDGRSHRMWLKADGSWEGQSRKGLPLAGRWSIKGDRLCLTQTRPATLPIAYCTAFPKNAAPGVSWTSHDIGGRPIRLQLVKGIGEQAGGS